MLLRHLNSSPLLPYWEARNPLSLAVTLSKLPAVVQVLRSHSVPPPKSSVHRTSASPSLLGEEQLPMQAEVPDFPKPPEC